MSSFNESCTGSWQVGEGLAAEEYLVLETYANGFEKHPCQPSKGHGTLRERRFLRTIPRVPSPKVLQMCKCS